ncbi:general secretion pathway protein GspB [Methylicorpusculum sp.]|uniref:general secretion pathway protein GspB n=1 Tax=Methylicorpusculum sp. TaxID=2713644 RepID=UPI002731FE05|nr:general secretion pathway protein GspB [Methylicorpusculum sp.]MDP2179472.1 general secretion pathway protein GspB [Methylicorpusculum sp.]MDP3530239.1 general secretion pathway protein GspB [Methylicorpusculum sp.]MDZ4150611.1 general secretion pathway protein GspB [Methylicorpusculum sp.]
MSYILNALRKSEQERQSKQPESVTNRILMQPPERKTAVIGWIALAILGNVAAIAGIIWYVQNLPEPPRIDAAPVASSVVLADSESKDRPKTRPIELPKTRENQPAPKPLPATEQIAISKPKTNPLKPVLPAPPKPVPVKIKEPVEDADKPASVVDNRSFDEVIEQVPDMTAIALAAEQKPEPEPESANKIPYLSDLPNDFRQSVPKMAINVFVYARDPAERFVIINMVKYKAGQLTKDEVAIKEILPKSLVLNYRDQTFQIAQP